MTKSVTLNFGEEINWVVEGLDGGDQAQLEKLKNQLKWLIHQPHGSKFNVNLLGAPYFVKVQKFAQGERAPGSLNQLTFSLVLDSNVKLDPSPGFGPSVWQQVQTRYGYELLTEGEDLLTHQNKYRHELLQKIHQYQPSIMESLSDKMLVLTTKWAILRVQILKFLALLSSLDHDQEGVVVKERLREMLGGIVVDSQRARELGLTGDRAPLSATLIELIKLSCGVVKYLPPGPLSAALRCVTRFMAKRFIAGENVTECAQGLRELNQSGRGATCDQLGELVVSEAEADHYFLKVMELIEGLPQIVPAGLNGAQIPHAHVSLKMSALSGRFNPLDFTGTFQSVAPRLKKLLVRAQQLNVFVQVDAEHYRYRDFVLRLLVKTLESDTVLFLSPIVGVVLQSYLTDSVEHFRDILDFAKFRHRGGVAQPLPVRLVKGAYWDQEVIEAQVHAHPAPQFLNKEETDLNFRFLLTQILKEGKYLQLCLASHNLDDHAYGVSVRALHYPQAPVIEHQCLHMTYEALGVGLVKMGAVVRNYVPVGNLLMGMSYLVRRILENSSQVGFLNRMRTDKDLKVFLSPHAIWDKKVGTDQEVLDPWGGRRARNIPVFFNAPQFRPYLREHVGLMDKFFKVDLQNFQVPPVTFLKGEETQKIFVGVRDYFNISVQDPLGWCHPQKWQERTEALRKAAELMLKERLQLTMLVMVEGKKLFDQALGDVDEAIDFLKFYALQEKTFSQRHPQSWPLGVYAAITPWNFPCAIPVGMVAAPLVAGNGVILKSSELTPAIGDYIVNLLYRSGVPEEILKHAPGTGEEVGATLTGQKDLAGIVFTGSKEVGTMLYKKMVSRVIDHPVLGEKAFNARCITEMGGKNAVIVTNCAEMDETISGVMQSAFGHSGQKCSALSRLIVDEQHRAGLKARLTGAIKDMELGSILDPKTVMGPLISDAETERVRQIGAQLKEKVGNLGGEIWIDRLHETPAGPMVVEIPYEVALKGHLMSHQEIFGPILHVIFYPAGKLQEAIKLANSSPYALTAGIFSQSQEEIDEFLKGIEAGNIYVNRNCTGARVEQEPFGGFKMSGTGPKAGGDHYLESFHYLPHLGAILNGDQNQTRHSVLPGQVTYTDRSLPRGWGGFVQAPENLTPLERHPDVNWAQKAGCLVEKVDFEGAGVEEGRFDFIIFAGTPVQFEDWMKRNFSSDSPNWPTTHLPAFFTSFDGRVRHFKIPRSVSINTMRHGAPL
jgi:RHH-type proline utilization regulon transcriptional repressor/proline dehydrogenase/delta 1-pyrroline-5-carboxylate dehydrogenase